MSSDSNNNPIAIAMMVVILLIIIPLIMLYHGWALMVSWNLLASETYQLAFNEATAVAVISGIAVGTKTVGLAKSQNFGLEAIFGGVLGPLAVVYSAWIISLFIG